MIGPGVLSLTISDLLEEYDWVIITSIRVILRLVKLGHGVTVTIWVKGKLGVKEFGG